MCMCGSAILCYKLHRQRDKQVCIEKWDMGLWCLPSHEVSCISVSLSCKGMKHLDFDTGSHKRHCLKSAESVVLAVWPGSGSKWHHQREMAAPIKEIFWFHFCSVGGSGGTSSIFVYSQWNRSIMCFLSLLRTTIADIYLPNNALRK